MEGGSSNVPAHFRFWRWECALSGWQRCTEEALQDWQLWRLCVASGGVACGFWACFVPVKRTRCRPHDGLSNPEPLVQGPARI